jgi:hypothetical protein
MSRPVPENAAAMLTAPAAASAASTSPSVVCISPSQSGFFIGSPLIVYRYLDNR